MSRNSRYVIDCQRGILPGVTVEPLRLSFRRQVREQALQVAQSLTVDKGWAQVRMAEVAALTGVSRPTLYKEFGDKAGLGETLVMQETDRFLVGISTLLDEHPGDLAAGIRAAVEFVMAEAEASPLLRGILTSARGGDSDLLPLLTTRSGPILAAAKNTLVSWLQEGVPDVAPEDLSDAADAVARLAVSHLVLPEDDRAGTAGRLTRIALRCLRLDEP
jgi:AcrR family transcriptional regulator